MAAANNNQYLESKVLTASQPQLHLMLIEAAVRQCRIGQQAGTRQSWGEFNAALDKAIDISEALVNAVVGQSTEISKKLEEQYAFIFRELAACRFSLDLDKLATCEKLLDFERETWKLVCDKTESQPVNRATVVAPHMRISTPLATESFSFEA